MTESPFYTILSEFFLAKEKTVAPRSRVATQNITNVTQTVAPAQEAMFLQVEPVNMVKEPTVIDTLHGEVFRLLGHAHANLTWLEEKLHGALAPEGPATVQQDRKPVGSSPLAHRLQEYSDELQTLIDRIVEIGSRVEL